MIKLSTGELKDILPVEFTSQPQVIGISYALKNAYHDFLECQNQVYVYAFIDGAPEFVLDLLAVELHVRYYKQDYNIDKKRSIVKNAILVTLKDGTLYAVNSVINTVFGSGKATDWYDYGGDPNHYKIDLDVDTNYDIDELLSVIEGVKRKTARLDGVTMTSDGYRAPVYFGSIVVEKVEETIQCDAIPDIGVFLVDEDDNNIVDENSLLIYGITT